MGGWVSGVECSNLGGGTVGGGTGGKESYVWDCGSVR